MDLSELYRDIAETTPDGIWVVDLEGRTVYANPQIAHMHRIPVEDLPDLTVFDALDEVGRAQFRAHLEEVRTGRARPDTVEVQWVRSDGSIFWVLCSENPLLDEHGRPWAILHRYTDNTRHHELVRSLEASEAALEDQVTQNNLLQAVASAANEAASLNEVLARGRELVLLHDDWERARAFVPAADGSGRVEPFYVHPDDDAADAADPGTPDELALAQRSYDTRASVWDDRRLSIAFPILLGGEVYAVLVITSAPPLYRYELIETMVERVAEQLARVAERERAQAELARARDEAMEASRLKSEFLATMSHEIRTPLNGVIGLNDLLLRTPLSLEQRRLASGVQVASRTLLGLINDILDFSKIEAGRLELEELDFEVRPLLERAVGLLTEMAREKGLDLVVSCHRDVPAVLAGDPTRLAQVISNLASNAVKFTEHGGVVVRATAEPEPSSGQVWLRVEVTDTGIGIPSEQLAQVFDPFTQADSSTTRIYGGTGLGLAISREIVEAMGGTIEYTPNPGGGSIFTCAVLLKQGKALDRSPDVRARGLLEGRRALVIAEDPVLCAVLCEQLEWWQMEATIVASADQGRAMLDTEAFDIVLTVGAAVPEVSTPQLVLTADPRSGQGADEVLRTPVLAGEVRDAMLRLLAGEAAPSAALEASVGPPTLGRVLVVEDNPVNQLVATGLLRALGYLTDTADDGLAAVEAAREGDFDAILMDVQMPHMDGYTATRQIRAEESGSRRPIIAMTAAAVEGERERCLEAGMDDFLTKPVDAARLAETLQRWLRPTLAGMECLDLERLEELRELDEPGEHDTYLNTYLNRAITNFLTNAESLVEAMHTAASDGDTDALRTAAHRLAGNALNLGVVALGESARAVEEHIANGAPADAVAALPALTDHLHEGLAALRAYQCDYLASRDS